MLYQLIIIQWHFKQILKFLLYLFYNRLYFIIRLLSFILCFNLYCLQFFSSFCCQFQSLVQAVFLIVVVDFYGEFSTISLLFTSDHHYLYCFFLYIFLPFSIRCKFQCIFFILKSLKWKVKALKKQPNTKSKRNTINLHSLQQLFSIKIITKDSTTSAATTIQFNSIQLVSFTYRSIVKRGENNSVKTVSKQTLVWEAQLQLNCDSTKPFDKQITGEFLFIKRTK